MKLRLSENHFVVKSYRRLIKEDEILMPHNLRPYYNIAKAFDDGENRVAIVHAPGTGKSFLAIRWLWNELNGGVSYSKSLKNPPISIPAHPNAKILYLAPYHAVINQVREHLNAVGKNRLLEHIEFVTYAKLLSMLKRSNHEFSDEELKNVELTMLEQTRFNDYIRQFSHIVVDEFHHADENKWGNAVQTALNNSNAKILGLTATPVRSTGKDVAQSVFNGNVVSTISVADAIEMGILPIPDYHTAIYSYEKLLTKAQGKIDKIKDERKRVELTKQVDEIKTEIVKSGGIKEKLLKHLNKHPNGKFIVFSDDIAMSRKNRNEILDMLSTLNISKVYDIDSSNPNAQAELALFRRDRGKGIKIAFAVDMISEGVHIEDLDGVIMLRSTNSFIVYLQQLGRALASGKDNAHPLVLDLVNNLNSAFEYKQQSNQILDFFRTIAARKTDDPTIQKLIMRLQKEDKILKQLRELDRMLSYIIIPTEEKLRICKLLVDKGVDLNKIKRVSKLSDYISLEEAGVEINYPINEWLSSAKQGKGGKDFIEGLRSLGFRDQEKKKNSANTQEKLRILHLLTDNGVDLNSIQQHSKISDHISLKKAGVEMDYNIGLWLSRAKQGLGGKDFIEGLRALGFRDEEKKIDRINKQEKLRILKLLVHRGVDLNEITINDGLTKYISLEEAGVEIDYNIGQWLKTVKRGIDDQDFIEELRALGFRDKEKKIINVSTHEKLRIFKLLADKGVDLNEIKSREKLGDYISLEEAGVEIDYNVGRWLHAAKQGLGEHDFVSGLRKLGFKDKEKKTIILDTQEKLRIYKLLVDKGIDLNKIKQAAKLSDYISLEKAGVKINYSIGQWLYNINHAYKNNKGDQELINGLIELGYKFDEPLNVGQ